VSDDDATIADGKAAWARIRERSKSTFGDWLEIGRMLLVGRSLCMKRAKCNSPYGPAYQGFVRAWLEENGLQGIDSHERRGAIVIVENPEIQAWRSKLSDVEQRRCNHPNSVLAHFRRQTRPVRSGPKTQAGAKSTHSGGYHRQLHFDQDVVRRVAAALREHWSTDTFKLARVVLDAAFPNEAALLALLDDRPPPAFRPKGSAKATSSLATELVHA
jgi:hypothetical protein